MLGFGAGRRVAGAAGAVPEGDLSEAKVELENVLTAIRQGLLTPATRGLLDACERRVSECETPLRVLPLSAPPVASLSTVITLPQRSTGDAQHGCRSGTDAIGKGYTVDDTQA